ncbi:MAG: hypothetical protein ACYCW6_11735 [Candidatus Xenobia bacterium]
MKIHYKFNSSQPSPFMQRTTQFIHDTIQDTVMAGAMATGGYLGGGAGVLATTAAAAVYGGQAPDDSWIERREYGALAGVLCSTLGCFGPAGIAAAAGIAFSRKMVELLDSVG